MNINFRDRVLGNFQLTQKQKEAALTRDCDIVVTAGAGSGKTSTLVARYVSLLADGYPLRSIIAITFTDKAAREMRSRVRLTLMKLASQANTIEERRFWGAINAEMDSARISTIHSLCAEIIRAHPVEAAIDPKFDLLDESATTALRNQVVKDTVDEMVGIVDYELLFRLMTPEYILDLMAFLLEKRLEAQEIFEQDVDSFQIIHETLQKAMQTPAVLGCITGLRSMSSSELSLDAGDALANQVGDLLSLWSQAENAKDGFECAKFLFQARKNAMDGRIGKRNSEAKETLKSLRNAYDRIMDPLCGGKSAGDEPPDIEVETTFNRALKLVKQAFERLLASYNNALEQRQALDFDSLEYGASQLLKRRDIREHWQNQIRALLVDEFQDTNERQRIIVNGLVGETGKLFVVGDLKQSIYRFRRADVTVFRSVKQSVIARNGKSIDLDETFRSHESILNAMGDLLMETMKTEDDPPPPYFVPYQPLISHRAASRAGISSPYVEFVIGAESKSADARPIVAKALASRLIELKQEGQIQNWSDVTLLFRTSTGYTPYENAFEDANIPFVTVAGRGFYNRPEIRDILNILRALADPTDDLAMAGLLRSPAFGLTDAALYHLRWQSTPPVHYWAALHGDLSTLEPEGRQNAQRVALILGQLLPLVDRIPVAELLKKLVDATDFRSILTTGENVGSGGRLWRNLDKLIADAQSSGKINVRDFLDYLAVINDTGVREGEAPAEARGSVRLMTIHRSKGLQFPFVVLADATRIPRGKRSSAFILPNIGLAFKLDPESMLFRMAKHEDEKQQQAEHLRVLYVALTRTQEKLIICGHATRRKNGPWSAAGWLSDLGKAANLDIEGLVKNAGNEVITHTNNGHEVRAWATTTEIKNKANDDIQVIQPVLETDEMPIYASLIDSTDTDTVKTELDEVQMWRATGSVQDIPPAVIGKMVHKAIELWRFPGNPQLEPLLQAEALSFGLAQVTQQVEAVRHCKELLGRFYNHPIRKEIEESLEHYHELPYSRLVDGSVENGYIDLLYRSPSGWQVIDFKTDVIRNAVKKDELKLVYTRQMRRYINVVETLLGQPARSRICFLDDRGQLDLVEV